MVFIFLILRKGNVGKQRHTPYSTYKTKRERENVLNIYEHLCRNTEFLSLKKERGKKRGLSCPVVILKSDFSSLCFPMLTTLEEGGRESTP